MTSSPASPARSSPASEASSKASSTCSASKAPICSVHPGPVLDSSDVTLSLGSAVHGDITDCAVNVSVRFGLQGVPGPVSPRYRVHGSLSVHLDLLLQLLDPLQLSNTLLVGPTGHMRLESLLTGDSQVADLTPRWLGLGVGNIVLLR